MPPLISLLRKMIFLLFTVLDYGLTGVYPHHFMVILFSTKFLVRIRKSHLQRRRLIWTVAWLFLSLALLPSQMRPMGETLCALVNS